MKSRSQEGTSIPMPNRSKTIFPDTITHEGREYVSASVYMEKHDYSLSALQYVRNQGLPYHRHSIGFRVAYYYNLEDCERWHRGEAV